MSKKFAWVSACMFGAGAAALVASFAIAQPTKDNKAPAKPAAPAAQPAGQPEFKLPPGWTSEDMEKYMGACTLAGQPGDMHTFLAEGVGAWTGKTTMWMADGAEPMTSECTSNVTSVMDGRFTKCEIKGEFPGMGPFHGEGLYGYDNVAGKLVSNWISNCGTGIMNGTGVRSADGKTVTWTYTFNCPVTKKPATMREVETITGPNSRKLESFGPDMKTGKEFKMMSIEFTRK